MLACPVGWDVGSGKCLYSYDFAQLFKAVSIVLGVYLPVLEREMDDLLLRLF